jgi:hypothetical protein
MKIWIQRALRGAVNGVKLRDYSPGRTYDVPANVGNYLVMHGFAFVELRKGSRSHRYRLTDRRRPLDR